MVDNRRIGDIKGNVFGPNTNFQGDDISQSNIGTTELNKALGELKLEIESIDDLDKKEDADIQYDSLIRYIDENKPSKVKKCLTTLKDIVGSTASILTIANQVGITF